jgi:hypothetical protein
MLNFYRWFQYFFLHTSIGCALQVNDGPRLNLLWQLQDDADVGSGSAIAA